MAQPRKPPNRTTTASIYVRCQPDEKEVLEKAAAKLAESLPGARLPVHRFLLQLGLDKAKEMGFTLPRGKGGGR